VIECLDIELIPSGSPGASVRSLTASLVVVLVFLFASEPALANRRVALVIGNSAYQNVPSLPNPANDAAAVTDMFKAAGFDIVESRRDLKNADLRRVLNNFFDSARDADYAIVYYAGHGIEIEGSNYIVPVDALLERDRDVYDETISLDRLVQSIEPAKQLRLVILDACRENPFSKSMKRTLATRGISRGLARVDPMTPNTLIAFAAKAGSTADDGIGKHSPFTTSILNHLTSPGLDLRKAFGIIRDEVMAATNNKQEPYVFGSLGGADVALVPAPVVPVVVAPPAQDIAREYEFAERVGTKEAWDYFLEANSSGFYAGLAKAQRNKLAAETARVAATEKAKIAIDEQIRLAVEGAVASEQAKAAAKTKAAEEARLAAERATEEAKIAVAAQVGAPAKVASLSNGVPATSDPPGNAKIPTVTPNISSPGLEPSSKETLDWDKVKDSSDPSALQKFIKRYPDSSLSINAQRRLDVLKQAAQEREEKARADREASKKAAEEAAQKQAELAAAQKREDEERRAKTAEAEEKAKAAEAERKAAEAKQKADEAERKKAELAAAKKRAEDEQLAKADAEQKAKAAEAERTAAEAKQRADEAQRARAAEEAAALRAASEKQEEAERKKAELAAAKKRAEDEQLAKADAEQKAKAAEAERTAAEAKQRAEEAQRARAAEEAAALRAASERQAALAEAERKKAELAAAQEATCKQEQGTFDKLVAKGSEGSGVDDMKTFSKATTCDRVRPQIVAALDKFNAEAAKRAAALPNSPELVRSAQTQLARLGCRSGKVDGVLDGTTKSALGRYLSIKGQSSSDSSVTEGLVSELTKQTDRVCPLECTAGKIAKGEICVALAKPSAPATASGRKNDDEDDRPVRKNPAKRQAEREAPRQSRPAPEAPRARQQAGAPSGGGGGAGVTGVGF
jgi:Caspase domain